MPDFADIIFRAWENLLSRPSGPLALRFVMQPAMAALLAIRDGVKDARTGRSPYFWTVLTDRAQRSGRLREGLAATARIIVIALVLDGVYQFIELDRFYPGEAVIVAIVLAFVPYLVIRGPAARLARWWIDRASAEKPR